MDRKLDPEMVATYIRSQLPAVKSCYDHALWNNPQLGGGKIVMLWTVDLTGATRGVRVESTTMADPTVADCVTDLIRTWHFAAPADGKVDISFPFVFQTS